jgi:enoyl-[acyl-carrier protein] reductase III
MRFKGKTALVTGSGRGIGRAIALKLGSEGADVIINFFRNRKPAEETAAACEELGARTHLIKADVGDLAELEAMFQEIDETFDGLDILVNNAASGYNRPIEQQKPRGWEWTININARSHLFAAQHALPLMVKGGGGSIVSFSCLGSTISGRTLSAAGWSPPMRCSISRAGASGWRRRGSEHRPAAS